jgi:hypothetical protein
VGRVSGGAGFFWSVEKRQLWSDLVTKTELDAEGSSSGEELGQTGRLFQAQIIIEDCTRLRDLRGGRLTDIESRSMSTTWTIAN